MYFTLCIIHEASCTIHNALCKCFLHSIMHSALWTKHFMHFASWLLTFKLVGDRQANWWTDHLTVQMTDWPTDVWTYRQTDQLTNKQTNRHNWYIFILFQTHTGTHMAAIRITWPRYWRIFYFSMFCLQKFLSWCPRQKHWKLKKFSKTWILPHQSQTKTKAW